MDASDEQTPLHILMTTDTVGGVWSYCLEICKALASFNVHFYLVTTGAPLHAVQKKEVAPLENVTVYETNFLLEWMEQPWKSIDASGEWLLQLENELQPDLIHSNSYVYGSLPWKAPMLIVAHSDVFSWWFSVNGELPPESWNEYYRRVQQGLQKADYLVAPTEAMLNAIKLIYKITTLSQVIYNGRNKEDFYATEKEPFVFSMGRIWDEAKNIRLLIDAAPHISYPIKLAGDNSFANNRVVTAATNVSCLGKLASQQVAQQLAAASVYVLPAKYEPFGLSILEAALSGCALVLGNIDSLKEIWSDSAIYVDTYDAKALANTINGLMENEESRMTYAKKASAQALKYSSKVMAENYLQLYRQLVTKKRSINTNINAANFFKTP